MMWLSREPRSQVDQIGFLISRPGGDASTLKANVEYRAPLSGVTHTRSNGCDGCHTQLIDCGGISKRDNTPPPQRIKHSECI